MHPKIIVSINGRQISAGGFFMSQLISLSLTDKEGIGSDTLNLVFAATPFTAIPRKKEKIKVWLGYEETGTVYFGTFEVNDADLNCFPYVISVSAKASDMKSELKSSRSKHYDDKTYGDVLKEEALRVGLEAVVSGKAASINPGWTALQNESLLSYGTRIAKKHDALFDIKDGKLLFIDKGTGKSATGQPITPLIITPEMHIVGSCNVKFSGRDDFKEVEAASYNQTKAKREIEKVPAKADAEGTLRLKHRYTTKEEAKAAAESKAKELQRSAVSTNITLVGNMLARGGSPMIYQGFHPEIDGIEFIIETATHSFSKGAGYLTAISAKVKV